MELTLQANKSSIFIKNYENKSFYIGDTRYEHNIIILNNKIARWNIPNINMLRIQDFHNIIESKPEIIIVGTGVEPVLPKTEISKIIQNKNIGIEFMKTESACKTFNLLISEERNVAGAFIS